MLLNFLSVNVYFAPIIYGTEIQEYFLSVPVSWYGNFSLIPHTVYKVCMFHSRQFTFRTKWNYNVLAEFFRILKLTVNTGLSEIKIEGPCTIQVNPVFPFKLRTWIFFARQIISFNIKC